MAKVPRLRCVQAVLLALLCTFAAAAQAQGAEAVLDRLAGADGNTLVLFFVASDCPVSNRYFPEMERIAQEFRPKGVRTLYLYPNNGEQLQTMEAHQKEFGAKPTDASLDAGGVLARWTGAHTTPEAALVVRNGSNWKTVFLGRIDDRFVHIGLERPRAEHHDLEDAIHATLANRPVKQPGGRAVGCSIVFANKLDRTGLETPRPH